MKKIFNLAIAAFALLSLGIACTKEVASPDDQLTPGENPEQVTPSTGKQITITATLSDALTKVSFDATFDGSHKPTGMAHVWQAGDKLQISKADNSESFELELDPASDGLATGVFTGTQTFTDASYNVSVIPVGGPFVDGNTQIQDADGSTDHLQFVASATGVTDLMNIELSETSNIIGIIAKLPAGAAEKINELEIETSVDDFATSTKLNILLTNEGDEDDDDILNIYANVPASWGIPANTKMFLRFKSSDTGHKVYTRYQEFATAATITPGKFNYIKMNCSNIDKFAGKDDDGTSAHPYLIADPYQMDAMHNLMVAGQVTYFKMIDDVDMTDISWVGLNNTASDGKFNKYINFDGNNKTVSNLTADVSKDYPSLFGVLQGSVKDLTIDHFSATSVSGKKCGAFAGYIGTGTDYTGSKVIDNVHVTNSKISDGTNYCGGFAAQLNQAGYSITNCTVEDSDITTSSYAAGFIAYLGKSATISDITVEGTDVTSNGYANKNDVPTDGFAGGIAARVAAAVDFDRCYYKEAKLTGSKNDNSTNSQKSRYIGGIAAYVDNNTSTFDDCHVNTITVALADSGTNNNGRYIGGAFGYIGSSVVVGNTTGCSVTGISGTNTTDNIRNYVGGFIGYNDGGTIKNSSSSGSFTGRGGCGGFVAYSVGGSYTDNTTSVVVNGVGNLGGFVGITATTAPSFTRCFASGNVSATGSYSGGFVGYSALGTYTSCSSTGSVSSSTTYGGGFAGVITAGSYTGCSSSGNVTVTGANFAGGFVALVNGAATISKSKATGNASANSTVGGFVGHVASGADLTLENSYSTGNLSNNVRRRGGLIAWVEAGTVNATYCYASGTIDGVYEMGGLIGLIGVQTVSLSKSAAWNSRITPTQFAENNWSTGAVVGVAFPTCTLTDNYRNPDMELTAYWVPDSSYQHANVSLEHPLVLQSGSETSASSPTSGQDGYPRWPYHGKVEVGKTLSQLASTTLGWDSSVWDFTGDLPTLK